MTVHSPDLGRSDCDETGHSRVKVSGVDDDSFECPSPSVEYRPSGIRMSYQFAAGMKAPWKRRKGPPGDRSFEHVMTGKL